MARAAIVGLLVVLAGCATTPEDLKPANPEAAWASRQSILGQQHTWALTGKLAVIANQEGWHAGVRWWQDGEDFQIDLLDSFGRVVARIEGNDSGVTLIQRDGSTTNAATPESLMQELYGWTLPLSGLRYWVLGIPAPLGESEGPADRQRLDAQGRLTGFEQAGWAVDYQHYQDIEPISLPDKMAVAGRDLRVKLIVDQWDLAGISEHRS